MAEQSQHVRQLLARRLEQLDVAGITQLARVAPSAADRSEGAEPASRDGHDPTAGPDPGPAPRGDAIARALDGLARDVTACTRCDELATTRTQTVFGAGDVHARLCFLGEAPGADEDRQGEPFVGRAGQLLDKIIHACQLCREDVYILNVLKCRPPGNRNPHPVEVNHCRPFLDAQLELIQPEFLCCLGSIAAQNLLNTTQSIGRLRGTFHQYGDIRVVCTYHPAYLLRNPAAKKHVWDDMKMLMRAMGVELQ